MSHNSTDHHQDQNQVNAFATEAVHRYDAFIAWMIDHWPQQSDPLTLADFTAGKREMGLLLGAKLHADTDATAQSNYPATHAEVDDGQYRPVTPAPWP